MCTGGDFCFTLNSSSTITFFMNRTQKICTFNNGKMEWFAPHVCAHKQKKTSSKQGKNICWIYVQLYLCSKVKKRNKNEQKKTHQTSRSKCNNGLKWFVHTKKQNLHSSHAKIKRQQLKNQRWTKTYQQNETHTHDVQINNNCVCYL